MSDKVMFVLFAGPEMPCKVQHAMLFARDLVRSGGQAGIIFEGNSPKLLLEIDQAQSKMAGLFKLVRREGLITGVCKGCAVVHGAANAAQDLGLTLLDDAYGHVSLAPYLREGYSIITF